MLVCVILEMSQAEAPDTPWGIDDWHTGNNNDVIQVTVLNVPFLQPFFLFYFSPFFLFFLSLPFLYVQFEHNGKISDMVFSMSTISVTLKTGRLHRKNELRAFLKSREGVHVRIFGASRIFFVVVKFQGM